MRPSHVDNTEHAPALLSICTGLRGLEQGIELATGREPRIAAYVEIEAFVIENLVRQMESGLLASAPIWSDLKTFPAEPFHNKLFGIVGGYPCQGESKAGKRKLWNDPRFLWPAIERILIATQPVFGFFENVSGHLSGSFPYVLASLRDLGYHVEAGIFSAGEILFRQRETITIEDTSIDCIVERCLPHERQRIFILAVKLEHAQRDGLFATAFSPRSTASDRHSEEGSEATRIIARTDRPVDSSGLSQELDNPDNGRLQQSEQLLCAGRHTAEHADTQLANGHDIRHPHGQTTQHPTEGGQYAQRNVATGHIHVLDQRTTGFAVARPGWPQHPWEAPRAIEPSLGCTVNGYNFREDLVRLLGNGVVPQAAERAFVSLFNKIVR